MNFVPCKDRPCRGQVYGENFSASGELMLIVRCNSTYILLLLLGMLAPSLGLAQSTQGKDFWLGFQENFDQSGSLEVYITSRVNTSGVVNIPGLAWTSPFTVAANTTTQVLVPMTAMASGSDVIQARGIHVTVNDTVGVYMLNYRSASSDAGVVFPTPALGKEYRVLTILGWPGDWGVEFMIVATKDNTAIEITPTAATLGGRPAGVPYTVTLNAGDVYQVMSSSDLTGTLVKGLPNNGACNDFAVFVGDKCLNIGGCTACDHIDEEIVPVTTWGTKYITVPLLTKAQDYFRILADKNNTTVTINGGAPIVLNAGGVSQFASSGPNYIVADKPILLMQYAQGNSCDGVGDPFQVLMSPVEQSISSITFNAFTSTIITSYYVNVVTRTAYTALSTLDGAPITFAPVPGNPVYSYAQLPITQGNHTLASDSGLLGYVYGFGSFESYGYPAGSKLSDLTNKFSYFAAITPICPDDTIIYIGLTDSTVVGWTWDFGDGGIDSGQTVSHVYTNYGDYTINLILDHLGGCSVDTLTKVISVTGPIGTVTGPDTLCQGASAMLTLTGDSSVIGYIWSTGDTTPTITINPTVTTTYWGAPISPSCQGKPDSITVNVIQTIAEFSFDTICFGDTTVFADLSTTIGDSIIAWNWNFDDGSPIDSVISPSHYYTTEGVYNVSLTVTTAFGCSTSITHPVSMFTLPNAGYSALNVCLNDTMFFVDTSTDSSGYVSAWQWDFGDGLGTNSIMTPTYLYGATGSYSVTLTVTTNKGCSSTVINSVQVYELPIAGFIGTAECASNANQFTDTSAITAGVISNWIWDFGDGDSSSLQNPSHSYDSGGTYTVTLIAFSNYGCSDTATGTVDVYFMPVADYSATRVCLGDTTAFTDASSVVNDSIAIWEWDFGNGSPAVAIQFPVYSYPASGEYNTTLIVTSGNGCRDTTTALVTVDTLPVPGFTFTVVCSYEITDFYDNSTVGGTDSVVSWQWDFDDGGISSQQNPSNDYLNSGFYDVQLVATTNQGCVDSITIPVQVYPQPNPGFANTVVCPTFPTTFTDSSSADVVLWQWDFDDGTSLSGSDPLSENPTHIYNTSGDYLVTLVVTSDSGCVDSVTNTVTVYPVPTADFTASPLITTLLSPYISFDNTSFDADSFYWDMGDNTMFGTTIDSSFVHIYSSVDTGTYIIKLIAANLFGCLDSLNDTIVVKADFSLFVPNAFSPNGDGINDVFFPAGIGLERMKYEMLIFDRWGDRIYETQNLSSPWDGKANKGDKSAQEDVYIWMLNTVDLAGKRHQYIGHVTLIR